MGKTVKLTIRLSPEDMTLLKSRTAKPGCPSPAICGC